MPLSISRRVGQTVTLSEDGKLIGTIRVVRIRGDQVRLAFDLPRDIRIDRDKIETDDVPTDKENQQ